MSFCKNIHEEESPVCECLKSPSSVKITSPALDCETSYKRCGIFLWEFLSEYECYELYDEEVKHKDILSWIEKKVGGGEILLGILLNETFKYSRENFGKEPRKLSALMGSLYYTHLYFLASRWRTPSEVYYYFRECILRHSVESPPFSTEVFTTEEAKNALIFFFETYLRNLPLCRILYHPHYKLKLQLNTRRENSTSN